MRIIEPNPKLIKYLADAGALFTDFDGGRKEFIENDEWHYIPSQLEMNIGLLGRLSDKGLLPEKVDVFDCGIGLGTTMFDLYLQSKEMPERTFTFTGVEKHDRYSEYLESKLLHYWDGRLNFYRGDVMDQNYGDYNLIYTYSPFKTTEKLVRFYEKLAHDIKPGSLIVESRNSGKGLGDALTMVSGLRQVRIEDVYSLLGLGEEGDEDVFVFVKQ